MDIKLNSDILLDGSELKNLTACSRGGIFGGLGLEKKDLKNKPVIGIVNSYTEINPGHAHLDKLAQAVKEGILQSGGLGLNLIHLRPAMLQAADWKP